MNRSPGKNLNALKPAIEAFGGVGPIVVDDGKISSYLSATADNELDVSSKLVALACSLQDKEFEDGWRGFCRIFEYGLRQCPDSSGLLVIWHLSALECWLVESHTPSVEERLTVVADTEKSLLRFLDTYGKNSAVAFSLGLLFFRHPVRSEEILKQALDWFRTSVEWAKSEDDGDGTAAAAQLHIGHCLFGLGEIAEALAAYQAVNENVFVETEDEEATKSLHQQLALCRTKLKSTGG